MLKFKASDRLETLVVPWSIFFTQNADFILTSSTEVWPTPLICLFLGTGISVFLAVLMRGFQYIITP